MEKKSIQFELWEECNNACKFCFLGSGNRYCSDDIKYESLKSTLAIINNDDIQKHFQSGFCAMLYGMVDGMHP